MVERGGAGAPANAGRLRRFVQDADGLAVVRAEVRRAPAVGVDIESNGFHAYTEKVCLLQLSTESADFVIDPFAVDLSPLGELFAAPERTVVFHAGEYDITSLKRDYGFRFARVFDTMVAAKMLGRPGVGLAAVVKERFGVVLAKDLQKSDWGRRPLSEDQLAYAFEDTRFLLDLWREMEKELARSGRLPEAEAEFARIAAREWKPRQFDPEGWRRLKEARGMDGRQRAILRALWLWREEEARRRDRPPFKIASEQALAAVAIRRPRTPEELARVPGLGERAARILGRGLLAAVAEGERGDPPPARGPGNGAGFVPEVAERYERLRKWRKATAEARGVPVEVVAPNALLGKLARLRPADEAALRAVEGMDEFRVRTYGADLVKVLAEKP